MWKPALAILGVLALGGALFALFGGALIASATAPAHKLPGSPPPATANPGGTGTDADCNGDAHGQQPNGDSSHQFPAGSVPPGVAKHCPPASVPEVPAAAALFGLLAIVGAGFLIKAGHPLIPFARGS
jgi:hypothetical protein